MNKSFSSLWAALGMLALLVAMFVAVSSSQADEVDDAVAKAVAYLNNQADEPTKTMALVAAGQSADVSYLKNFSGSSAIEYTKPIMAIVAAGEDPRTFPQEDFVERLKSSTKGDQLGKEDLVNDDIWGILALRAAGIASSDRVVKDSRAFILENQNADGGWPWNVGGTSDTNDTAAAIMALLETGMDKSDTVIQDAVSYLKGAQNDDGGFPYDPHSEFGTDSDGNSDAWVIMALRKMDEDTSSAVSHLLSLQDEDGGFWWMAPPADFNNKGPTADAVIALTGKWYPVPALNGNENGNTGGEVFYRVVGSTGELCRGTIGAKTAMDVVVQAAEECGYTYEIQEFSFGLFLSRIGDDAAEGAQGWLYRVNGELPDVGAADYALSGGESVLWYYGGFDDEPPVMGDVSDSVELSVEIVEDSGDGGGGGGGVPEIAFTVSPSALHFRQLVPGDTASEKVTLKNEGRKNLSITAETQGDPVFSFLKIGEVLWNAFGIFLPSQAQKDVDVQLSVPAEYNVFGQKQGTLIFWGTVE